MISRFLRRANKPLRPSSGPPGKRVYAIGDIHGRADMLEAMLMRIVEEEQTREPRQTFIVFLGDLIDRGPDSAGVVERLMNTSWGHTKPIFLMGNHEEMFLRILEGADHLIDEWLAFGGFECAQSYGAAVGKLFGSSNTEAAAMLRAAVPADHVEFLRNFGDSFLFGDYLFVHAGIRPGSAIEKQSQRDLRWIREGFLDVLRDDELVVVHGHTIAPDPEERDGRIGIDTGAYMGGGLTALCVEDQARLFLRVHESDLTDCATT